MIKLLVVSRRLSGMTRQEYFRHFQHVHAAKILAGPAEMLENLSRYVQNYVIDGVYGSHDAPMASPVEMDSVSEIYNHDQEAVGRLTSHPHYLSVVQPDEHLFADISTLKLMMAAEEDEAVAVPREGSVKLMHFIATREGTDRGEFFTAWRAASKTLVDDESLKPALCRYVRSHALPVPADATGSLLGGAPVNLYTGAASLWFDGDDDLSGIDRYRARFEALFPADSALVDASRSMFLIVRELQLHP